MNVQKNTIEYMVYTMTRNELKVFLAILMNIKEDNIKNNLLWSTLEMTEIRKEFEYKGGGGLYRDLQKHCESIVRKATMVYFKSHGHKNSWAIINIFDKIAYEEGTIMIEYNPSIKDNLIELKQDAYNIFYQIKDLKSKYSIRIYQCLKDYEKKRYGIMELKEYINANIPAYHKRHEIKEVIDYCMDDINRHSDIDISYNMIVDEIEFKIKQKIAGCP
jgi:plasmid replication initiation protein